MPPFAVAPCTIEDGPALARNNMSAFWTDSTWVLIWRGKTLEYVIEQATRRTPHNLLDDPARRRHQKAIDTKTGALVGYLRWILPEKGPISTAAGGPADMWLDAQVPAVNEERRREAEREFTAADWEYSHASDELDAPMLAIKERLLKQKEYLSEWPLLDGSCVRIESKRSGYEALNTSPCYTFLVQHDKYSAYR